MHVAPAIESVLFGELDLPMISVFRYHVDLRMWIPVLLDCVGWESFCNDTDGYCVALFVDVGTCLGPSVGPVPWGEDKGVPI